MKRFQNHLLAAVLLIALTIPAFKDTISAGYFPMHDDLQAMRQLVMAKCFQDGQVPCRWSADMGYGYGYPIFNYYPPLPYYLGQVVHFLGFQFVDTVKVLVILNFILSGLAMYLLAQTFFGKLGGLISGVFYVYAPYHSVDIYVRGAMNEAWALVFFPLVFWAIYKLICTNKWFYLPLLAVFTGLLMLCHNPILMIFVPLAIAWAIFWLAAEKKLKNLAIWIKLLVGGLWALGLAAFFTLPVIFENQYVHVETLTEGYFNYLAHFVTLNQLFVSRFWGYGPSKFGPDDGLSLSVGHLHWIFSLVSLLVALFLYKKNLKIYFMILFMFTATLFYTFMIHERSSFVWSALPVLAFMQFPWRFLTITIFGTSFLSGSTVLFFNQKLTRFKPYFAGIVIILTIFFYQGYFHWEQHWPWVNDQYKFSGELWRMQITSGIFDYLPKFSPLPPGFPAPSNAELLVGNGKVETLFKNSTKQIYLVETSGNSTLQINTFYFPGWKYFVNNREVLINPLDDKQSFLIDRQLGRPRIKLEVGKNLVEADLTNTPVRQVSDVASTVSWLALISILAFLIFRKRKSRLPGGQV